MPQPERSAPDRSTVHEAPTETGLPVVTEVMDPRDVELVARHAAVLQIGSRNMQNFPLLREVGPEASETSAETPAEATAETAAGRSRAEAKST